MRSPQANWHAANLIHHACPRQFGKTQLHAAIYLCDQAIYFLTTKGLSRSPTFDLRTRGSRSSVPRGRPGVLLGFNSMVCQVIWVKQCHKPDLDCDLGDGLLLVYPH